MNMKKLVLILVAIMVLSFIIAAAILFTSAKGSPWGFIFGDNKYTETINQKTSYAAEDFSQIKINTASADIRLIPTDGDNIEFHFYGKAAVADKELLPRLEVNESGKSLSAKIKHPSKINIGFNYRHCKLDVYVPVHFIKELEVKSASGDIEAEEFELDKFNAVSVSGDLIIENLKAKKASFQTTSGDILLDKFTGKLELDTVSGDIESSLDRLVDDVKIKAVSGDVILELPEESDFYLNAKAVSGKITSDFRLFTDNSPGSKRMTGQAGNGENDININTVSGDIFVNGN